MKITRRMLRRWGARYDDKRISELVPKSGLTPLEIAALENVPVEDRLWVLLREDVIPARDLRLLACDWAEAACHAAGWNDERSLEAIAVARRFADGEATEDELVEAARSAAWAARSAWAAASGAWAEAAASAAAAASAVNSIDALGVAIQTAKWAAASGAWAEVAAWAQQLAYVVRVLKRIDEAAKAGKEAKQ